MENINTVAADFSEARRKAEEYHRQVQEIAALSQNKHELLNPSYEKLKQLREKRKLLVLPASPAERTVPADRGIAGKKLIKS